MDASRTGANISTKLKCSQNSAHVSGENMGMRTYTVYMDTLSNIVFPIVTPYLHPLCWRRHFGLVPACVRVKRSSVAPPTRVAMVLLLLFGFRGSCQAVSGCISGASVRRVDPWFGPQLSINTVSLLQQSNPSWAVHPCSDLWIRIPLND